MRAPVHGSVLALCCPALFACSTAHAAVWIVDPAGGGDFTEIQPALDAAADGDFVNIVAGQFSGSLDFLGKRVRLVGMSGRGATRVDLGCPGVVNLDGVPTGGGIEEMSFESTCVGSPLAFAWIHCAQCSADLRGIVLRSFNANPLVLFTGSPGPTNPFIVDDFAIANHGIGNVGFYGGSGWLNVSRGFIGANSGASAAAISGEGVATFSNVVVNLPDGGGAFLEREGVAYSPPGQMVLQNVTVAQGAESAWEVHWLQGSSAVGIHRRSNIAIRSAVLAYSSCCTYIGCPGEDGPDALYTDAWPLVGATVVGQWDVYDTPGDGNCGGPPDNDVLVDPTGQGGNLSEDPEFVAWSDDGNFLNDDLCLSSGSAAIDAGDPDPLVNDPDGSRNDMGAFGGPDALDCAQLVDSDGDGYFPIMGDCDDADADRFPFNSAEVAGDGMDADCSGLDLTAGGDDDSGLGDDDSGSDDGSAGSDDDSGVLGEPAIIPGADGGCPVSGCGRGAGSMIVPLLAAPWWRRHRRTAHA